MKRNKKSVIGAMAVALLLAACGNTDSKVNQVIQNQMQTADNKNIQSDFIFETEAYKPSEITEKVQKGIETDDNAGDGVSKSDADVDLTKLSSTMVYSEVYNMMYIPERYVGKTVKMKGTFTVYANQDYSMLYPAVIIADATACCSQGLEFVLEGNPESLEDYPEMGTEITVMGTFETYVEDGTIYCRLQNAKII